MAAEAEAYALAAVSQAPEPFRRLLESMFGARPGIVLSTDWAVTQNGTPNMSVNVAAGRGLVDGSESSTQGFYFCQSNTTTNVVIQASNATNPRRDIIVGRIKDNDYATGPTSAFSIEVITGTAAASPVDPTIPANCFVIARVAVAATVTTILTANITDLRTATTGQTRAAALGGTAVCTSTTRPTVGLYEGTIIYETDTDHLVVYDGAAWTVMAAGYSSYIALYNTTTSLASTGATFTLPPGKWLIFAKCEAANLAAVAAQDFNLQIWDSTSSVQLDKTDVFFPTANLARFCMSCIAPLTNATSRVIQLRGTSTSGGSNYQMAEIRLVAHAVSAIN